MINAGDINGSEVLMDEFIADFNEHPYAGSCLGRIAIGYYKKGYELKEAGRLEIARQHFEGAADTFERIMMNNLTIGTDAAYVYFYAGANYLELKRREDAIECLQKVADDWPGFEHACSALAGIGGTYEFLRDKEDVPREAANPLIEEEYKTVLSDYPNCYSAPDAAYNLAQMREEEGDKAAAVEYYKTFLKKARCGDARIPIVKTTLMELEGINQ